LRQFQASQVIRLLTPTRALLLSLFAAAALTVPFAVHAGQQTDADAEARAAYNAKAAKGYTNRFGPDKLFLPSNMQTATGQFIDPKLFPTAQYCGHCHQEAHAEWRESAHANSNRVPYYLRNVNLLNAEKGINFSRHCEGCHDPIAVAAGAITEGAPRKRPYDQDGVTCMVCHSIQSGTTRGTGSFPLGIPAVLEAMCWPSPRCCWTKRASPSTGRFRTQRSTRTWTATPRRS
jgi:hypothetical protein